MANIHNNPNLAKSVYIKMKAIISLEDYPPAFPLALWYKHLLPNVSESEHYFFAAVYLIGNICLVRLFVNDTLPINIDRVVEVKINIDEIETRFSLSSYLKLNHSVTTVNDNNNNINNNNNNNIALMNHTMVFRLIFLNIFDENKPCFG